MVYGAPSHKYPIHFQLNTKAYRCMFNSSQSQTQPCTQLHAYACNPPPIPYPSTHACTHTTNACIVLTAVTVKHWNKQKSRQNFRAEVMSPAVLNCSFASTLCDHAWISTFHVDQIQMLQREHFMSWYCLWGFSWKKIAATVQVLCQEKGSLFSAQVFVGRIALI